MHMQNEKEEEKVEAALSPLMDLMETDDNGFLDISTETEFFLYHIHLLF